MGKQLYLDSNVKYCDLKDFLKAQFVIFRCQKYVKKGTWKWETEFTLSPPREFPGCPRSLYFTLLFSSGLRIFSEDILNKKSNAGIFDTF